MTCSFQSQRYKMAALLGAWLVYYTANCKTGIIHYVTVNVQITSTVIPSPTPPTLRPPLRDE
jgi:hypothetical protein